MTVSEPEQPVDSPASMSHSPDPDRGVAFPDAVRAWFAVSLQTFGGPAGQIAIMQRHLVDERRWIGRRRFQHALNYCMVLPGPEAQQLAIYIGWLLNGIRGGVVAGVLFVLPGTFAPLVLSAAYVGFGDTEPVTAVFAGVAPAIVAVVAQAAGRLGARTLHNRALCGFAVTAFVAFAAFGVPFPVVIAAAAFAGWALHRRHPQLIIMGSTDSRPTTVPEPLVCDGVLHHERPSARRAATILTLGLLAWSVPVAVVAAVTGMHSIYTQQGLFFSGTAVVSFGGAYGVLAFVTQRAVEHYAWLSAGDVIRGLALAETTPGPLIMVVQFVAFVGAYHHPGTLHPWTAGIVASLLTAWVTFVPSVLLVLLSVPYVERLRDNQALSAALTGVTAAVVGVIANLGLYVAVHTLFDRTSTAGGGPLHLQLPELGSLRPVPTAIAAVAAVLIFRLRWPTLSVLSMCAGLGLVADLADLPGMG